MLERLAPASGTSAWEVGWKVGKEDRNLRTKVGFSLGNLVTHEHCISYNAASWLGGSSVVASMLPSF